MKIIFILYVMFCISITAQEKGTTEYFPGELNFKPFMANILEPRMGFVRQFERNAVRLDIGRSLDFVKIKLDSNTDLAFGADMFTYTSIKSESEFHFPVDAVDYLFGVNASYIKRFEKGSEAGARLRFSHISAHLVDGHFDGTLNVWKNNHKPRVYSREFFEFMPYYKMYDIRLYTGITYLINTSPDYINKTSFHFGAEYMMKNYISESITPYAAYDLKLIRAGKYSGNNSLSLGVRVGKPESSAVSIYYTYYQGYDFHGEYFDFRTEYSAFGINIDI